MQPVCSGCSEKISSVDSKDIFDENAWLCLGDDIENINSIKNTKQVKLNDGIEQITGLKINRTTDRSFRLCKSCFEKVESFLNFRARLLASLAAEKNVRSDPSRTESAMTERVFDEGSRSLDENKSRLVINNENTIDRETPKSKISTDDVINVDENSTPIDFYRMAPTNEDCDDTNDSCTSHSDSSKANSNNVFRENTWKKEEKDLESDIDVCSGEEDEVFELDSQSRRDEIVEIESSSESDIEVCDYEPAGKRIKCYSEFSPAVLY